MLSLGNAFFQKNVKFALSAWKEIGVNKPRVWMYGRHKELAKFDPKKITYYVSPTEEEVADMHRRSTFFVATSYHEGFAMPPIEAMACGSPVITTDSHGNRDYTRDGENCVVVEQDNIPALKAAMEKVLADPKLRERIGKNGAKVAKEFSWDKVMGKLVIFYQDLASQPRHDYIKKAVKKYQ
jgi:glycosyltransferase involved in cell wall biosynthesis